MKVLLCGKCKFFVPNGGVTSDSAIYAGLISPRKLGNCTHRQELPYGRLKNEHNGCENFEVAV
jgi:hypothetical protein